MTKNNFFVYDEDGNQVGFVHAIDALEAVTSGKFTKLPPGALVPILEEPEKREGVTGIDPIVEAPTGNTVDSNDDQRETLEKVSPGKGAKAKTTTKIPR